MSLRSKVVLILTLVIGSYAAVDHAIQRFTFAPIFEGLEHAEAGEDLARIRGALEDEAEDVDATAKVLATSDSLCAYTGYPALEMTDEKARYEAIHMSSVRLENAGLDVLFILDQEREVLFSHAIDPDTGDTISLRDFPTGGWGPNHFLLVDVRARLAGTPDETLPHGILGTEHKPLFVSCHQIRSSEGLGEPRGFVVAGRFLANDLKSILTELTQVDFDFWPLDGTRLEDVAPELIDQVTSTAAPVLRAEGEDEERLAVYSQFDDVRKNCGLLLRANVDRKITGTGSVSLRYALISTVVAGLLMVLVLLGLLQRAVLRPLSALTDHAVRIGKTEDFHAQLGLDREDEVGILSREFDQMMGKLQKAREAIVDTARAAGMSEIATGILHNVGNVLNSVNISASMVAKKVEGMELGDLQKLSAILTQHADDLGSFVQNDPKGKHLQPYLSALTDHLGSQRDGVIEEVHSLVDGIDHIRELIKSQQSLAMKSDLFEPRSLAELCEEAVNICDKTIPLVGDDAGVTLVREYGDHPPVLLDKHRVLEILVNLVQNARQALDAAETSDPRLTLRILGADDGQRIEVQDNGIGIPKENLTRIFHLGFTTRSDGHGYGLHTAANAATEMGGSLTADSDGPGRGTTFALEIPNRAPEPTGAAS